MEPYYFEPCGSYWSTAQRLAWQPGRLHCSSTFGAAVDALSLIYMGPNQPIKEPA